MSYSHTQEAPLHYWLHATTAVLLVGAWLTRGEPVAAWLLLGTAVATEAVAFSFRHLTVREEGEYLAIRFGPLPLFSKRLAYTEMTSVAPDRTTLIDGWGIHYVPLRGWTYNLWGYDCVKVQVGGRVIRIGSDDVDGLTAHLTSRIPQLGTTE